jgi:hypothetical protein
MGPMMAIPATIVLALAGCGRDLASGVQDLLKTMSQPGVGCYIRDFK